MNLLAPMLAGLLFAGTGPTIHLRSAETAEVSSFLTPAWKQLHYDAATATLIASVAFTNEHSVSDIESRKEERVDFTIPNVVFDKASGSFLIRSGSGRPVPIAAKRFLGVELNANSRILLIHNGRTLRLELEASDQAIPGERWVEIP